VSVLQVGGDFSGFVLVRRGGRPVIYMVLWRRKGAAVQGTAPGFHHFFLVSSDGPKYAAEGGTGGGGYCHTRFYRENRMHLTCAPGSFYTHMIDKMSVIPLQ
jgi:hypothetical protein